MSMSLTAGGGVRKRESSVSEMSDTLLLPDDDKGEMQGVITVSMGSCVSSNCPQRLFKGCSAIAGCINESLTSSLFGVDGMLTGAEVLTRLSSLRRLLVIGVLLGHGGTIIVANLAGAGA